VAGQSFKYRREDFEDLRVTLNHVTIHLNFMDDFVEATNCLEMTAREPLDEIELDAKDLEIIGVEWVENCSDEDGATLSFNYLEKEDRLNVRLPWGLAQDERFFVRTLTRCVPSEHILEGIYKDTTPPGAPQQYVSQCQQWGFQRIMPIIDDCRAKCTMTTTIEAAAAYTHLITNGNISSDTNPDGIPVPKPGDPSRQVITYENPVPMAPYLFVVCVGTWDTLVDQVTFDSGRTVRLEYLVPPGRTEDARIPMQILKQAVLWIEETQDYQYTGDTYRTICMNKSNFGGMENVGNTTIVTDAALIDEHTLDQSLFYAHGVIVHEFEHNQCGSETTMETPFDVWLNEAYTVHVERQFLSKIFDPTFVRLGQVDSIRHPILGPLAIEDGGRAGRIVRDGFNSPDELIDGVTYVKAAEVIRMLQLILGEQDFRAGKALYFSRYYNSNANTDQFFECFEEVSGQSLTQFKEKWLYSVGYPRVTATTEYDPDAQQYRVTFRQQWDSGGSPFHLPIEVGLVDEQGSTIPGTRQVFQLKEERADLVFENILWPPACASLNRDYSFYGAFELCDTSGQSGVDPAVSHSPSNDLPEVNDSTRITLAAQVRLDTNPFNRVEAMRRLTDIQRIKLLLDSDAIVDDEWLSLYGEILSDRDLPAGLKAYFLRVDEQPMDRRYSTWYPELVDAREKLMLAINRTYSYKLVKRFYRIDTYRTGQSPWEGIEDRMLKNVLLGIIAVEDTRESHGLIMDHFRRATTATDRVAALGALNRSSAPERREMLEQVYQAWHSHVSGYANYLRVVAGGTNTDVFEMIEDEQLRPSFDLNQPTLSRALFLPMAANNKMIWSDRGVKWLTDTVIRLSTVNDYTASRLLNAFQQCGRLKPELQSKVRPALERIAAKISKETSPTIHGQAKAYLGGD